MRWVQEFSEGSRDQRELLGGKGAGVAEMTRVLGAERVPAGFTITTEACVAYMEAGRELPDGLAEEVDEALAALERTTGKALGDPEDPLLVSVRSGARVSMPGMLDTVLNLGPQRRVGRRPRRQHRRASASPGTPTGASCRCSATSSAGSRRRPSSEALRGGEGRGRRRAPTPSSTPRSCAS